MSDKNVQIPSFDVLPVHLGIIMDGNGRWAKKRNLPRTEGHKQGAKTFKKIADYAQTVGIKYLTVYAFSTENWSRPQQEIDTIMSLFEEYLDWVISQELENEERGVHLTFLGDKSRIPQNLVDLMDYAETRSADKDKFYLNIAVNYGGRREIVQAVQKIAEKVKNNEINLNEIDEDLISSSLYTSNMPDPDLIIRPSGEFRLSNFLTWQSSYSELWFSDCLWPDFDENELNKALFNFEKRQRRFGGV